MTVRVILNMLIVSGLDFNNILCIDGCRPESDAVYANASQTALLDQQRQLKQVQGDQKHTRGPRRIDKQTVNL